MTKTQIGQCLLIASAILPAVFRRQLWLRTVCIIFILLATVGACMRVHVAPRMAVDRLNAEVPHPRSEDFGQGFQAGWRYTYAAVMTAIPIFIFCVGALTVLACVPPIPRESKSPNDRN